MNKKFATFLVFTTLVLQGCLVHPPQEDTDLGPEVSPETINAAMEEAQAGIDPVKGFQQGDSGTVLTLNRVLTSSAIQETDLYEIIDADATTFTVQKHVVETNQTEQGTYYRPGAAPTPLPSSASLKNSVHAPTLIEDLKHLIASFRLAASRWLSKVRVEPSTALGETPLPLSLLPGPANLLKAQGPWTLKSEEIVRGHLASIPNYSSFGTTATYTINVTDASPTPTPTPADGPVVISDQFFRLKVSEHQLLTKNCAQIKDCTVHATHMEFEELISTSDGQTRRIHRVYEFSKLVPGIFRMMDRCWSALIAQNGSQIPLTHCDSHLDDFRWGSN